MVIALDPKSEINYILKCDRDLPEAQQTIFILKTLSARESAKLEDGIASVDLEQQIKFNHASNVLKILEIGLMGWKNFFDSDGNEVKFKKHSGILDYLKPDWRVELSNEITERNTLTGEDLKN